MLHRWRNTNNGENFNLKRNNNKMVNIISNKKIIVKMLPTMCLPDWLGHLRNQVG